MREPYVHPETGLRDYRPSLEPCADPDPLGWLARVALFAIVALAFVAGIAVGYAL
jgi:hypothetical protein